jgi:hypothetical protein
MAAKRRERECSAMAHRACRGCGETERGKERGVEVMAASVNSLALVEGAHWCVDNGLEAEGASIGP